MCKIDPDDVIDNKGIWSILMIYGIDLRPHYALIDADVDVFCKCRLTTFFTLLFLWLLWLIAE